MDSILKDLKYAARTLVRNPGFAVVAIVTIALGIGANTAIFSVIHAVMIRPLPYDNPDQLVLLRHRIEATDFMDGPMPPADVMDIRDHTDVFQGVAATDRLSGERLHIRAKTVINTAGPWVDQLPGITASLTRASTALSAPSETWIPSRSNSRVAVLRRLRW